MKSLVRGITQKPGKPKGPAGNFLTNYPAINALKDINNQSQEINYS